MTTDSSRALDHGEACAGFHFLPALSIVLRNAEVGKLVDIELPHRFYCF